MKTTTILKILHVLAWIFFLGVCVEAGSFLFNMIYCLAYNPMGADYFALEPLLAANKNQFAMFMTLGCINASLKALAMYWIVKIFYEEKLDLNMPFSPALGRFVFSLSYISLAIGICSYIGAAMVEWLVNENIAMPSEKRFGFSGADVHLFMSATLFVIAQLFKRGIEIQSENELTI